MTISSSMNAGVMGLSVNATRLATISDNIANSSTYGYKRSDVDFSTMVIKQSTSVYSAGGVRAQAYRDIYNAGALISTGNSTDLAISGNGMIPVTDLFGTQLSGTQRDFMMVPTGSFTADEDGFLRTLSGLYLLGWPANADGTIPEFPRDTATDLEPVNIEISTYSVTPTRNMTLGLNLPADETLPDADGTPINLPVEYYDNLGRAQVLTYTFTPEIDPLGATNSWAVSIYDGAGDPTAAIASFDVSFNDLPGLGGTIETITPGPGATYDPLTGKLDFAVIGGPISTQLGRPNEATVLSQISAAYSPDRVNRDGAPIGTLQSVEVDEHGFLEAIYNSGFRRTLYQIPVADVPDMNSLEALNNQAYAISFKSGDLYLWEAGSGPTGSYAGYSLMESTSDIAAELTSLIETQRAYSSNAKIIQTVDEMLQETTNLKR